MKENKRNVINEKLQEENFLLAQLNCLIWFLGKYNLHTDS